MSKSGPDVQPRSYWCLIGQKKSEIQAMTSDPNTTDRYFRHTCTVYQRVLYMPQLRASSRLSLQLVSSNL